MPRRKGDTISRRDRSNGYVVFDLCLGDQPAVLQAIGLVARFDDVAVVCQPIQQRHGHLGATKYARPFREAEVDRDDHAFVKAARLM